MSWRSARLEGSVVLAGAIRVQGNVRERPHVTRNVLLLRLTFRGDVKLQEDHKEKLAPNTEY